MVRRLLSRSKDMVDILLHNRNQDTDTVPHQVSMATRNSRCTHSNRHRLRNMGWELAEALRLDLVVDCWAVYCLVRPWTVVTVAAMMVAGLAVMTVEE